MIRRIINRGVLRVSRSVRNRRIETHSESVLFHSSSGYRIAGTLTKPIGNGPWPGVVLCPGADHDRRFFRTRASPIRPDEIAALGIAVLTYDPSGRGESWGPEDFGGPEHQDNAAQGVHFLRDQSDVLAQQIGIIGISLGIASAMGAARILADTDQQVAWVLDWEGPCDQRTITANQTMNAPAMGHKPSDTTYWHPREAVNHMPYIQCGYHRLQAYPDHAQPEELSHATAMMEAAADAGLPWFQLNHESVDECPTNPRWLAPGPLAANRALLSAVHTLMRRQ